MFKSGCAFSNFSLPSSTHVFKLSPSLRPTFLSALCRDTSDDRGACLCSVYCELPVAWVFPVGQSLLKYPSGSLVQLFSEVLWRKIISNHNAGSCNTHEEPSPDHEFRP
jgi:hypothetical protein